MELPELLVQVLKLLLLLLKPLGQKHRCRPNVRSKRDDLRIGITNEQIMLITEKTRRWEGRN